MYDPVLPIFSSPQVSAQMKSDSATRRLCFVNWKMGTIKDTIRKLEREMANLRIKSHTEEVVLRKIWNHRREESVELYSKAHLQSWSSALYAKLPRELRDIVYTLCLDHEWDDHELIESLTVLYGYSRPQEWNHDRLRDYVLLDPSFVSKEVAIEIAEMIYARIKVPSFGMNRREGKPRVLHLKEFLKRDFFGLGIPPAPYIRNLTLKLLKSNLSTRNQDALRINIESLLLCLPNRHRLLQITIVLPRENSATDVLFFLHLLYDTLTTLTSGPGNNIMLDISYKRSVHGAITPDANKDEIHLLNLTHMLELPQGMWRDHVMALCECVGKLSRKEQRWEGYRAFKSEEDAGNDLETVGETLAVRDSYWWNVEAQCEEEEEGS